MVSYFLDESSLLLAPIGGYHWVEEWSFDSLGHLQILGLVWKKALTYSSITSTNNLEAIKNVQPIRLHLFLKLEQAFRQCLKVVLNAIEFVAKNYYFSQNILHLTQWQLLQYKFLSSWSRWKKVISKWLLTHLVNMSSDKRSSWSCRGMKGTFPTRRTEDWRTWPCCWLELGCSRTGCVWPSSGLSVGSVWSHCPHWKGWKENIVFWP